MNRLCPINGRSEHDHQWPCSADPDSAARILWAYLLNIVGGLPKIDSGAFVTCFRGGRFRIHLHAANRIDETLASLFTFHSTPPIIVEDFPACLQIPAYRSHPLHIAV